jgi:formylglycine-generating enzyme required for sulfatase activity
VVSARGLEAEWIEVPAGAFFMGGGPRAEENPSHVVTVSAFRLARAPVTRAEYQRFLDKTGHDAPPFWGEARFAAARLPAVGPSWDDAMAYCRFYAEITGAEVGLPTEAEWERAAKADRDVAYPWGDAGPEAIPGYERRWLGGPEPVDLYPSPHPWGFLGLGENVHEWCADWYDADYYQVSPAADPRGPESGKRRASRGGSWRHDIRVTRCAARSSIPPHLRYADYGFRLRASSGHGVYHALR